MSTWQQRMSERAKARAVVAEAERITEQAVARDSTWDYAYGPWTHVFVMSSRGSEVFRGGCMACEWGTRRGAELEAHVQTDLHKARVQEWIARLPPGIMFG